MTDTPPPVVIEPPSRPTRTAAPRKRRLVKYLLRAVAVGYVAVLVAMPLVVVVWRTIDQGASTFWDAISAPDAVHAYQVTAEVAGLAVLINTVFGVGVALLLARY
ncbi:MAG TPA: hypothetical protein VE074_16290, partial [Jatrophihabitantaceae bacterium]|nr:hypothetical protein [Jatrophihabitantaceae bacterium]